MKKISLVIFLLSIFSAKAYAHDGTVIANSNETDLVLWFSMFCLMGLLGIVTILSEKKNLVWAKVVLSTSMLLVIYACKTDEKETSIDTGSDTDVDTDTDTDDSGNSNNSEVPANDPDELAALFWQFDGVSTDSDETWFYLGSNGLPDHNMMVGITNWQQQVPIDQDFSGDNRWQLPIQPVIADEPLPMEGELFRNAIGIAVNGIPLFHPMTTSGVDSFASGQLDQWGGHSGRADDYHYHLPPIHLQSVVGEDQPVAFALDGFPIYGETTEELDENLGRFAEDGSYRYHTIPDYPYFMAGLKGEVDYTETADGQGTIYEIIPQPRTQGARPSTEPLGGSLEITEFTKNSEADYSLTYVNDNEIYGINYSWDSTGTYIYEFVAPDGSTTTETHQRN